MSAVTAAGKAVTIQIRTIQQGFFHGARVGAKSSRDDIPVPLVPHSLFKKLSGLLELLSESYVSVAPVFQFVPSHISLVFKFYCEEVKGNERTVTMFADLHELFCRSSSSDIVVKLNSSTDRGCPRRGSVPLLPLLWEKPS